jgi:hypothetical protein
MEISSLAQVPFPEQRDRQWRDYEGQLYPTCPAVCANTCSGMSKSMMSHAAIPRRMKEKWSSPRPPNNPH